MICHAFASRFCILDVKHAFRDQECAHVRVGRVSEELLEQSGCVARRRRLEHSASQMATCRRFGLRGRLRRAIGGLFEVRRVHLAAERLAPEIPIEPNKTNIPLIPSIENYGLIFKVQSTAKYP